MKYTTFYRLLLFAVSLFFTNAIHAQVVAPESIAYELFKDASEQNPITVEYAQIPDFCFGHRHKNTFVNFSQEQLQVLSDYNYPKFTSHGLVMLETDILAFQSTVKAWNVANRDNETAIRTALGFN